MAEHTAADRTVAEHTAADRTADRTLAEPDLGHTVADRTAGRTLAEPELDPGRTQSGRTLAESDRLIQCIHHSGCPCHP